MIVTHESGINFEPINFMCRPHPSLQANSSCPLTSAQCQCCCSAQTSSLLVTTLWTGPRVYIRGGKCVLLCTNPHIAKYRGQTDQISLLLYALDRTYDKEQTSPLTSLEAQWPAQLSWPLETCGASRSSFKTAALWSPLFVHMAIQFCSLMSLLNLYSNSVPFR